MAHKSTTDTSTANLGFEQKLWLTADMLGEGDPALRFRALHPFSIFPQMDKNAVRAFETADT